MVGFCEGDHAATPADIIESLKITEGVIKNHHLGSVPMVDSQKIQERKKELVTETTLLLEAIKNLAPTGTEDPWSEPQNLAQSVKIGLLDAPHLCGNPEAAGKVFTLIKEGACRSIDPESGAILTEKERISRLLE